MTFVRSRPRGGWVSVQRRHERVHRRGQGESRIPVQCKGL